MTSVTFHPAARDELEATLRDYFTINPELAREFDKRVSEYRQKIGENPLLYSVRKLNIRRANLNPRFGEWYLAYVLWKEQAVILALGHAQRRPYYFRGRLNEARGKD